MVDTGAAPNLIKRHKVKPDAKIDARVLLKLTGITDGEIKTLGELRTHVRGHAVTFHVVNEDFPIPQDGILGADFLSGAGTINFINQTTDWHGHTFPFTQREVLRIPARSRAVSHVRILNHEAEDGYIPRLNVHEGVYLGNAVVKNRNGKAYLYAINTTPHDVEIPVPAVKLERIDAISKSIPKSSESSSKPIQTPALGLGSSNSKSSKSSEFANSSNSNRESTLGLEGTASASNSKSFNNISNSTNPSNSYESICESALGQDDAASTDANSTSSIPNLVQSRNLSNSKREPALGLEVSANIDKINAPILCPVTSNAEPIRDRTLAVTQLLRLEHLSSEESQHVNQLIKNYNDIFHLPDERLGYTNATKHAISTTDEHPIHTKQYRFPPIHKDEIDKQVRQLLENDVIKPSTSPYNSPLWIVPKKADSQGNKRWRMVIDYRSLNEKTIGDAYPLPNITEILDQLGSAKYFSVFDLASGFHQIQMDDRDAPKTAFSTPYGHYQFQRMPFGLKNAPATFQRLMDQVLTGLQGNELFVYLDDIVLYSSSLREHAIKFERLAARLRAANLKLQPDKCEFLRKEVMYLGHIIGEDGVRPDPKKIEAVQEFPQPRNPKAIKQFLGLAGYYRRFIPNFSKIARPLTDLLKKEVAFRWEKAQEEAFCILRNALCSQPLLQYPDFTKPFVVTTDASQTAIGGILSQGTIGKDLPIAYTSRLLNDAEQNYSTIERELLAIVYAVNYFRPYLFGRKFQLVTDHKPLTWLNSVKDPTSRLVRWRLKLAEYDYEVIYKAGKTNVNADALSRNPVTRRVMPISSDESLFHASPPRDTSPPPHSPSHCDASSTPEASPPRDISLPQASPPRDASPLPAAPPRAEDDRFVPPYEFSTDDPVEIRDATNELSSGSDPNSDSDNDDDNESADDSDEPMFDPATESYRVRRTYMPETRDSITSRRDSVVVFATPRGKPCDEGARLLREANLLPVLDDGMIGRAKVIKSGKKNIIVLMTEDRISGTAQIDNLRENISSLRDVTNELQLESVSISKGPVIDVSWENVRELILREFRDSNVTITVCTNAITTPPKNQRPDIIRENHDTPIGGHKGVTKTLDRIRYNYQWPKLRDDVQRYIKQCRECQLKKLVRLKTRQPMVLTDTPGTAFEKISMDIMGPLPMSQNGFSHILTVQDLLTKFSLAIPLRQTTSTAVADAFVNEFICIFGAPRIILTDQGSNFVSSLLKNVARKFKIKQVKTTAYRPQSNGSVERSHQVLWEYLKQFAKKDNWDEYLKLATFSSNTSVHEGTQYTPYELVFGKTAETPSCDLSPVAETNETYAQYLTTLFDKLRDTQQIAQENLRNAKARSKRYYDKRARPRDFNAGDLVYLLREPLKHKLDDQYSGPYKILDVLPNHNVKLEINRSQHRVVHTDKIKLAHLRAPGDNGDDDAAASETTAPERSRRTDANFDATAISAGTRHDARE